MTRLAIAALALLGSCVAPTQSEAQMHRATYRAVVEGRADRPDGDLSIGWIDYVRADARLTPREVQRCEDVAGAWDQWIREMEGQAR